MLGLKPWNHDDCLLDKKRSFEDASGKLKKDLSQTLPLLLWIGQPNDEDDDNREKKRLNSCPLTKKKVLRQQKAPRIFKNRLAAASWKENNGGLNSKYVKVKMEGVAIARKIDLRLFHSYQTLTNSLITMFDKCLELEKDSTAKYTLAYQDKDGDWLLAGDVPWHGCPEQPDRLWNLRGKLKIITDPCAQNAVWSNENANPRVACDCLGNICHITPLKIYALDISGEIPSHLFVLKDLMDLLMRVVAHRQLQGTSLEGPIPSSFSALNNLEDLRISDLSGEDFSLELRKTVLTNCLLSGQIPELLGTFSKLKLLCLGNNNLTGELPANIIGPPVNAIDVSFNPLSGNLPQNFAKLDYPLKFTFIIFSSKASCAAVLSSSSIDCSYILWDGNIL
ncbi:hypothetical protein GH714_039405 [Hevea brasiliensis]|uniref:Auxin-responsive protein n=1 Tax=Hevea brasiliensis TaxID=3981 RepID=A0A6A6KFL9_HEVBR|nr:hypothetical protein GH714_039405 [Hevea brasiliensis]